MTLIIVLLAYMFPGLISTLKTNFHGPEVTMQAFKEGKQPTLLASYDAYEPHQWPACSNNPKGEVAHICWQQPTVL